VSHPLHPALVHFPIACWSLATISDVASLWTDPIVAQFANGFHLIGTSTAIAAMLAGLIEISKVNPSDSTQIRAVNLHMVLAITSWCLYALSLFWRVQGLQWHAPGLISIGFSVSGFICLAATGYLGANLVYKHQLGVRN